MKEAGILVIAVVVVAFIIILTFVMETLSFSYGVLLSITAILIFIFLYRKINNKIK